jgi:hypothetical protein
LNVASGAIVVIADVVRPGAVNVARR